MNTPVTHVGWMEPMMPPEEGQRRIEDAAFDLVARASSLAGQTSPIVTASIGTLVRSMNCYYSNLIEGHDTHPRDIDRALRKDYSAEPARRTLQLEAVAHIAVQKAIDEGRDLVARASSLAGQTSPIVTASIGTLVRSMNCYYSNLIEGHDTHPRDIDRA